MSLEALLVKKTRAPTIALHSVRTTVAIGKPSNLVVMNARLTVAVGNQSAVPNQITDTVPDANEKTS